MAENSVTHRIRFESAKQRGMQGTRKEGKLVVEARDGYRTNPMDDPSGIPNACSHETEPWWSTAPPAAAASGPGPNMEI